MLPASRSASSRETNRFFDDDGTLVGALFTFSSGLDLDPYSVLRHTLTLLKPTLEFYLSVANSPQVRHGLQLAVRNGRWKTTTQYLVISARDRPTPCSRPPSPLIPMSDSSRRIGASFLNRLRQPSGVQPGQQVDSQGAEDKEPFASLQQFARGQTAQLSYCGTQSYDIAADAYRKSIASGFTNKSLAGRSTPQVRSISLRIWANTKAKAEMLQSLAIRPITGDAE